MLLPSSAFAALLKAFLLPSGIRGKVLYAAAALVFISPGLRAAWGGEVCRHDLKIELRPEAHRLIGRDDIRVDGWKGQDLIFLLADKAHVKSVLVNGKPWKYSFNAGKLILSAASVTDGSVRTSAPRPTRLRVTISFDALFNDPIASGPATFENPGSGVMGSIGGRGTFLLEDSGWYPTLQGCSQGFDLQVTAPVGIYAVTAGELIGHEDRGALSISRWKTEPIGQGLSLSAGRYIIHSLAGGDSASRQPGNRSHRRLYTYFTSENDSLSKTYLDAAASHIAFYEQRHGPYPFPKFAIVENFFPSGYGFPSYTLLGSTVLRLPFIPQTSLRHEIAHSWWGNGVLVDYASGNWCEGLTTYVADYLSQEITSAADARLYRQQILQDYATLAASGADFPLRLFGGCSSPATRAVGYGKAAFVFHMIRQRIGDEAFWKCLRQIYKERLFVRTSWDDFRDVFVRTGGWGPGEAKAFFDQWLERSGAPVLKLQDVQSRTTDDSGWQVTGTVLQEKPWYGLDIVATLKTSTDERVDTKIRIENGSAPFSIRSTAAPVKIIVDPDVNTFRLLSPEEIPATVNSVKGSQGLVAVLSEGEDRKTEDAGPSKSPASELLLEGFDQADAPILSEKEAEMKIGEEKDFLFFGFPRSEKLKELFASAPKEVKLSPGSFSVKGFSGADCLFLVFKDPNRAGRITALFLPISGASPDSAVTAARKITHYGKYSYLAFSNGIIQEKGVWEIFRSPLEFDFIRR